jgi:hypothetical protein
VLPIALGVLLAGCSGGSKVGGDGGVRRGNTLPTVTQVAYSPGDATLKRYSVYSFQATASDPDIGDTITKYEWDFGDTGGQTILTTGPTVNHSYILAGTQTVKVRAYDSTNAPGSYFAGTVDVDSSPSPITVSFTNPTTPLTAQADPGGGVNIAFTVKVTTTGSGTIGLSNVAFNPGDTNASIVQSIANGGGSFTFTARYNGSATAGSRVAAPSVKVTDSTGVSSDQVFGPSITINTLSGANNRPTITITNPSGTTVSAFTSKAVTLAFTLTDLDGDTLTYTVDWGDGTPVTTGTATGTATGSAQSLTHTFPDSFTSSTQAVLTRVNATDSRSTNGSAIEQTRTFNVTYNTYPTATITTPQASGTLPSTSELPSDSGLGLFNPPGPNDPDLVVIPSGGKIRFNGAGTPPGSGDSALTYAWTFQGGVPASSTTANPGEVVFSANAGTIVPYLVELKVTDAFGRASAAGPNASKKTYRKWVVVDGTNTQSFNLALLYRLKADNNAVGSLSPVRTSANGLGAVMTLFQDGLTNTYAISDPSGQAQVQIPVRSNLPFFVQIPGFGADTTGYLMRIPNAPSGPFADPTLGTVLDLTRSSFGFENASAPFNPSLRIVTSQGFAPENSTPTERRLQGFVNGDLILGQTPANVRWLDRLSIHLDSGDSLGALNQWVQSNNVVYSFAGLRGNQTFAEWTAFLLAPVTSSLAEVPVPDPTTAAGNPSSMGFVLDGPKYTADNVKADTFAAKSFQAFRVPGGVTDPYDITLSGSTNPSTTSLLAPTQMDPAVALMFSQAVYGPPGNQPFSGGIQGFPVPYDANDPDRSPYESRTYFYAPTRTVFSMSEYLWSKVWARPLVLNQASLSYLTSIFDFPYFRFSNPAAWPMLDGIAPDNSAFDLTATGGPVFDASSPVAVGGDTPSSTGVGRFFWAAYAPYYNSASGSAISRTWLADDLTSQPPLSVDGEAGDAVNIFGFAPPLDTVVDKRGRNANGSLNGSSTGGYRITWYNPTVDSEGTPVPPDFWVVELRTTSTQHFLLPGSFPAGVQSTSDLILTDARTYLPSGRSPADGPAGDGSDKVAPGYCWFDIPVELRPTTGTASLIVYGVKAILKNNAAPGARALSRPDWIDAIKTASATMRMLPGGVNVNNAHKIPFNYHWDIVVVNGPLTFVAP